MASPRIGRSAPQRRRTVDELGTTTAVAVRSARRLEQPAGEARVSHDHLARATEETDLPGREITNMRDEWLRQRTRLASDRGVGAGNVRLHREQVVGDSRHGRD